MSPKDPSSPHFAEVVGYTRLPSEPNTAVLELLLRPELCNTGGTVHGGVLMTMLDTAGMWASSLPGRASSGATVSISCNFVSAVRPSECERLIARAKITRAGKRMYFANIEASALPGGKLVATAQAVYAFPPSAVKNAVAETDAAA
ncbi:PaaI family thioesterase [Verticiella sediminum]|uniref:PaaI family thioesterase n=1 Tax=Verticiella sediminum TaxID=1247510 RepID=A0A556AJ36_9BURK|nr:PaaI family thioesterase [Verticiella sediminum]TSH92918.1 PaaI family thioesterase [Verticiella sediminum]